MATMSENAAYYATNSERKSNIRPVFSCCTGTRPFAVTYALRKSGLLNADT